MSGIRVTYSGLIHFAVNLISVVTGLIFTIIVTRQLSQEEFGTWGLIGVLTGYMLVVEPIIGYWSVREIARGSESGKTAYLSSGLFSFLSIPFYLLIVYFFGNTTDIDFEILFFAGILIPVRIIKHTLASIDLGHSPQITAYSLLISECVKIILGIILIYFLQMELVGVIYTVFFSTLSAVIYSTIRSRKKLKGKFELIYIKKWLKLFWLPIFPQISKLILTSDVVIFTIIIGSVEEVAYWFAAMTIAGIVLHSSSISKAIYSKLLEGGEKVHVEQNFERVLYFAIPLTAMTIIFAKPGLFALNPNYESAFPIVVFLAIGTFFQLLGGVFSQPLLGTEKVDIKENATFRDYIKSKLVFFPTLRMIQRVGYLASFSILMLILNPLVEEKMDLIIYWSILFILIQIPYALYIFKLVGREFNSKINWAVISKYIISSMLAFGLTFVIMEEFLIYDKSIFVFLPQLIPFVILSLIIYLGTTFLIDKKTRKLVKIIICEIKRK